MPYPSLPGLVASDIFIAILLIAPIYSLQYLAYVYCALALILYLLEVLASYHILFCKLVALFMTEVLH